MKKKDIDILDKTLVEKFLDKNNILYKQFKFPTSFNGKTHNLIVNHLNISENIIFKTLALQGNKSGPLIAVIPLNKHVDTKKLSKISQNKKVSMVPLKELVKTTGYEHGANTPIGIHNNHPKYPIFIDKKAQILKQIIVSSGQIGRSIQIDINDLLKITGGKMVDIAI